MHHVLELTASASWSLCLLPLGLVATISVQNRSLGAPSRWGLAAVAASAPLWCPSRGVASTLVTGFAIVFSVRLTDREDFRARRRPTRRELALWLLIPMVARLPQDERKRRKNRALAWTYLVRAAGKRAVWELIHFLAGFAGAESWPWPLRTALLVIYFVVNLTALADVVLALCRALGCDVDEVFDWPLISTSPREFWSRRWNRFINRYALKHIAIPLRRRGVSEARVVFTVFLASGVFHEYFALGVSGLQTVPGSMLAFFLLQVAVMLPGRGATASLPRWLRIALTAIWMAATAPLFFMPLEPALRPLDFPGAWFPWTSPSPWDALERLRLLHW